MRVKFTVLGPKGKRRITIWTGYDWAFASRYIAAYQMPIVHTFPSIRSFEKFMLHVERHHPNCIFLWEKVDARRTKKI